MACKDTTLWGLWGALIDFAPGNTYYRFRRSNKLMGSFGVSELLIILAIVVIIFGASRLPQLGKGLGEGIRNFRDSLKTGDDKKIDKT